MSGDYVTRSCEFRAGSDTGDDGRTLEGYAATFDSETSIRDFVGQYTEVIAPGAFRKTLRERKGRIVMQFDHGMDSRTGNVPIGVYEEIKEDGKGLAVRGRLFDNDLVEPIRQAIEAGAITGMSFRFQVVRDEWRDNSGKLVKKDELQRLLWDAGERGPLRRTLKEVKISEAGPVVFPAYQSTSVGVRNMANEDHERQALFDELYRTMQEYEDADLDLVRWLVAEADWRKKNDDEDDKDKKKDLPFEKDNRPGGKNDKSYLDELQKPKKTDAPDDEDDDEDDDGKPSEKNPNGKKVTVEKDENPPKGAPKAGKGDTPPNAGQGKNPPKKDENDKKKKFGSEKKSADMVENGRTMSSAARSRTLYLLGILDDK